MGDPAVFSLSTGTLGSGSPFDLSPPRALGGADHPSMRDGFTERLLRSIKMSIVHQGQEEITSLGGQRELLVLRMASLRRCYSARWVAARNAAGVVILVVPMVPSGRRWLVSPVIKKSARPAMAHSRMRLSDRAYFPGRAERKPGRWCRERCALARETMCASNE